MLGIIICKKEIEKQFMTCHLYVVCAFGMREK